jgi:hypothetical protein
MLTQARGLDVTETRSALEAALLETDEIKRLDPPYNVQLRSQDRDAWFASPELSEATTRPEAARWVGPVPSRFALAAFGGVRALALGADLAPDLIARAMGMPPAWSPEIDTFRAGWASFQERHVHLMRSRSPWAKTSKRSGAVREALEESADDPQLSVRAWDADRVRRHLERAVLAGGQLMRRARWLCLASDASFAFREQGTEWAAADRVPRRPDHGSGPAPGRGRPVPAGTSGPGSSGSAA